MEKITCHDVPKKAKANSSSVKTSLHPDHSIHKKRLNRIRGQLEGIDRMVDERRYCIDIVSQIRAAASALKSLEKLIIETHLKACVRTALQSKDAFEAEEKIREIMNVLG